jgi:hypothetical protein
VLLQLSILDKLSFVGLPRAGHGNAVFLALKSTFKFWDESGRGGANDEFIDLGSETIGRGKLLSALTTKRCAVRTLLNKIQIVNN